MLAARALPGGVRPVVALDGAASPPECPVDLPAPHRLRHATKSIPTGRVYKAGIDMAVTTADHRQLAGQARQLADRAPGGSLQRKAALCCAVAVGTTNSVTAARKALAGPRRPRTRGPASGGCAAPCGPRQGWHRTRHRPLARRSSPVPGPRSRTGRSRRASRREARCRRKVAGRPGPGRAGDDPAVRADFGGSSGMTGVTPRDSSSSAASRAASPRSPNRDLIPWTDRSLRITPTTDHGS